MAIFKCKMCGGALEIGENQSVATCEYCGTQQTLPKLDNEKKLALFSRANNLRIKSEFDKAAGIYESIIAEFRDEAEAYWGLVLCKYGIEYVDDGKGSKIPTCHRTLPLAIMEDDDFQQACEYADITAKSIYRDEAKAIDIIQKKILNIALNEEPYDIFICYKETDDVTGSRTEDSLLAQDIYTELLKDGYRVFFSRVSLRDVAGTEYEPYIFAALSSAKVMLAIGTKHDYYDAVWVKNEWSRFISMIGEDSSKVLIPCFKNMDAYDMPKEFKNMQALDMGDVTFFGSLTDSIERIVDKKRDKDFKETIILNNDNVDVAPLLERGFLCLEDKDWDKADSFFEMVLNKDPKNAQAYLGELLADLKVSEFEKLSDFHTTFSGNKNYEKIMRFADNKLKESVKNCNEIIVRRLEEAHKKDLYENALEIMESATTEEMFENAGYMFIEVKDYADAKQKSEECFEKGEIARKDTLLAQAEAKMTGTNTANYVTAISILEEIPGWKDADEKILTCRKKIEEIKAKEKADRIEQERKAEEQRIERERKAEEKRRVAEAKAKKNKKLAMIITPIVAVVLVFVIVLTTVIIPNNKYNDAVALMNEGKYEEAIAAFEELDGYKNSLRKIDECINVKAIALVKEEKYKEAVSVIQLSDGEKNLRDNVYFCVKSLADNRDYNYISEFVEECDESFNLGEYTDELYFLIAEKCLENNDDKRAAIFFGKAGNYSDAKDHSASLWSEFAIRDTFFSKYWYAVGVSTYGSVEQVGDYYCGGCEVKEWNDIVAVSGSGSRTVGLKSDGTVIMDCDKNSEEYDLSGWTDITAISVGSNHTIGLKSDGTVVAVGSNVHGQCEVSDWTDIVAVYACTSHTVGLKADGTVVATDFIESKYFKDYGQCEVSEWTDIVAISAGNDHTVGLKTDGTVVGVGDNEDGRCDVNGWKDIVSISVGSSHTVALKSDGTVVATGDNEYGQCDVDGWKDIVSISVGSSHTVGLKSDGTVVAVGYNAAHFNDGEGQCDVEEWNDIVAISAGESTTMGLKSDGTVAIVGFRYKHPDWEDIKLPNRS